ncbi:DUF2931 family protein [Pseudomonas rustica]|uniref:DUF2931 family protein n=1 Tax=Pseudomonas rustica TaxID=2827099 RepID=UPI003CF39BD8
MNKSLMQIRTSTLLFFVLSVGACTSSRPESLPYDAWQLSFGVPDYMEVWIETAAVIDINDQAFGDVGGGVPAYTYPRPSSKGAPAHFKGNPKGWPQHPGGKGQHIIGAALPMWIYVRWQSMAEPQTYEAYIKVPQSMRDTMLKGEKTYCGADGKWITDYRENVIVGLAPGGIAKVWLGGQCLRSTEALRVKGRIHPKGPNGGPPKGKYRPLQEESKAYVEKFGIPYESW